MEYCSKTPTVRPDQNTVQPDQREKEVEDRLKIMKDLKEAYEWAMEENWNAVTKYFEKNPKQLLHKMTVDGDTILHLAASCSRKSLGAKFLKMSIKMLSSTGSDQGRVTTYDDRIALRVTDNYGNNILHEVSVSGNMEAAVYLVTYFNEPVPEEVMISTSRTDKDNYALQAQDTEARDSENYALQLLETKNYLGETPLFRAAALGHAELVKFYAGKLQEDNPAEEDLSRHFHRKDKKSILHIAVTAQHFGTALWLLEKYPKLAQEKEENGLTSLQLLAQMPTAFVPKFERSKWKMLIYYCLPVGGDAVTPHQKDDLESNHPRQSIFRNNLADNQIFVMKAYHSFLGSLAKGPHREIIYNIWKEKKNKNSLKKLIQLLVQWDDYSWLITDKQPKIRTISLGSGEKRNKQKEATRSDATNRDDGGEKGKAAADEHLSGVRESTESDTTNGDSGCKKEMEATTSKKEARNEIYNSIPLLIAAVTGFLPIVLEILKQYPQAVEHVNCYDRNILHLAIKNRQKKILDLIQSKPTLMSKLNRRIDHNGNTILHQAADRSYYSIALSQKLIGPAMQLQEELRWMLRIKEMLPPHYIMHHNENDQTAEELFNAGHDELLKSAQEWVKETAQSCSTVAVLVATVVFAAAYAIPGGFNDQSGRPIFQDNPLFLLFTCMDVVAIACSLSSVAFFLSILSSPLEYPYFVKSIPRKVLLGFVLLFFSMATTMLAFGATILLLIRIEKKWTMSLLYPIAFFPVPLFGLLQFPMNQSVQIVFQKIYDWFFKPLGRVLGHRKKRATIWGQE